MIYGKFFIKIYCWKIIKLQIEKKFNFISMDLLKFHNVLATMMKNDSKTPRYHLLLDLRNHTINSKNIPHFPFLLTVHWSCDLLRKESIALWWFLIKIATSFRFVRQRYFIFIVKSSKSIIGNTFSFFYVIPFLYNKGISKYNFFVCKTCDT